MNSRQCNRRNYKQFADDHIESQQKIGHTYMAKYFTNLLCNFLRRFIFASHENESILVLANRNFVDE